MVRYIYIYIYGMYLRRYAVTMYSGVLWVMYVKGLIIYVATFIRMYICMYVCAYSGMRCICKSKYVCTYCFHISVQLCV